VNVITVEKRDTSCMIARSPRNHRMAIKGKETIMEKERHNKSGINRNSE